MDETAPAWSAGERAGAVLLVLVAIGLLLVGLDVASGGRLTGRGCGCHDDEPGD